MDGSHCIPQHMRVCQICQNCFDLEDKKPVLSKECQHCICHECLLRMQLSQSEGARIKIWLTCPFCKVQKAFRPDSVTFNITLIEWIKRSNSSESKDNCHVENDEVEVNRNQASKKSKISSITKISPRREDEDLKIEFKSESLSKLNREEVEVLMTQIKSNIYKEWERAKLKSERKAHKIRRLNNFDRHQSGK